MKLIKPLFLDELWDEFHTAGENHNKLKALHGKISKLRFLDPACGCGNFLITSFKEIRLLELAIVEKLLKGQMVTNVNQYFLVDLDQFYGIEIGEFPSQIAQVAMFLIDHQMNMLVSDKFGEYIPLIPLQKSAVIVNDNALTLDWQSIIKPLENELEESSYNYILGNPPFIGHHLQTIEQKEEMNSVLSDIKASGVMDYVSAWYMKAAQYLQKYNGKYNLKAAFVSTNSITQGEQVGILWSVLMTKYKIKIHFAHRTFKWNNEAKGVAVVYCVIVGFSNFDVKTKKLYSYPDIKGDGIEETVSNINPYLVEAQDIFVVNRSKPICKIPQMMYGNKPTDGGHFLMTEEEMLQLTAIDPLCSKYIRPFLSAKEYINGLKRYCIWLVNASPQDIRNSPVLSERVELVRKFRKASVAKSTRDYPYHTLFRQVTQPSTDYLVVPRHSSEKRKYIPIGFIPKEIILADSANGIADATLFHFAILTSEMHMTWVRYTCGRIKSDFRYSKDVVYNNFPWPETPTDKHIQTVEEAAQALLDARAQFPESCLADLYDPITMPPLLVKVHQALDKAVDQCYSTQPFISESKRIEYLFGLYEKYTAGMFAEEKPKKVKKLKSDL